MRRASTCAEKLAAMPNSPIAIATACSQYVTAKLRSKMRSEMRAQLGDAGELEQRAVDAERARSGADRRLQRAGIGARREPQREVVDARRRR